MSVGSKSADDEESFITFPDLEKKTRTFISTDDITIHIALNVKINRSISERYPRSEPI